MIVIIMIIIMILLTPVTADIASPPLGGAARHERR